MSNRRKYRRLKPTPGASPTGVNRSSMGDTEQFLYEEYAYIEVYDRDDEDDDHNMLRPILRELLKGLNPTEQLVVDAYIWDVAGADFDPKQGVDAGIHATERAIGINPATDKPIAASTVKRNLASGLAKLAVAAQQLPDWKREILARSLVPGALSESSDMELDDVEHGAPELPEWATTQEDTL